MTPRPYQKNATQQANRLLNAGRHPAVVMPTGSGKTIFSVILSKDRLSLNERILIIVPQLEIFDQFLTEYSKAGLEPGYINDEGVVGRNRKVYICMYQSLSNLLSVLPEKFINSFSTLIIDECHHSGAESYENIFDCFSHCQRVGLTATLYRFDNLPLGKYFTDIVEPLTMSDAINGNKEKGVKKGTLCKPVIIIPDKYKDLIPEPGQTVDVREQRRLIDDKTIIGDMVETYRDVMDGLPVIVPCSTHSHAEDVSAMFSGAGWSVRHIHSNLHKTERKKIIREVKQGKINILVTVGVGVEGMDIPGLYGIIWMRLTGSLTIYMQFNGRPMRPAPGKKYFVMIDPVGNSVLHGRPDIDRKWSLETGYVPGEEAPEGTTAKICPVCNVSNAPENGACWICGYDFITGLLDGEEVTKKKRKLPKMIDGELVYLDGERDGLINKDGE
jgi:superfamily II DNA or RNA helicase